MELKNAIIKQLMTLFSVRFRDKLQRETTLRGLYRRLAKKRRKLKKQISASQNDSKVKLFNQKLRVIEAQMEKIKSLRKQSNEDEVKGGE